MDGKRPEKKKRGLAGALAAELAVRRTERGALIMDVLVFLCAFFFSRTHIAFGAYPLGIALVATLPSRTVIAAVGAVAGAIALGEAGIIYAILIPLALCLRLILRSGEGRAFGESYLSRVLAAAISSALGGLYEIIVGGFALASVLFASVGVLLGVAVSFSFFGLFTTSLSYKDILFGREAVLSRRAEGNERIDLWLFQGSALVFIFFLSRSLSGYEVFGISPAYVLTAALTLFVAVRFGALRAMAVGFMGGFAVSSVGAVGFALAGLGAGALFSVGIGYALIAGGVLLSVWSGYSGGLGGFLSTFPEYGVAALLMLTPLKRLGRECPPPPEVQSGAEPRHLVDTAARGQGADGGEIESSLMYIAAAMREFGCGEEGREFEEYRNIVLCASAGLDPAPCEENVDALASKLYKRGRVCPEDVARLLGDDTIYGELMRLVGEYERECYVSSRGQGVIGEVEHISRMLAYDRYKRAREGAVDRELSERVQAALVRCGFPEGEARVLGVRRKCLILAAEDESGEGISSKGVREAISASAGAPLCDFEYYKKDKYALMKCYTAPAFSVDYATVGSASERTGVSGDSTAIFERDGALFSVISDGMGSGECARRTSAFVAQYLTHTLIPDTPSAKEAVASLSGLLRARREECAATADIFSFDLYTGEGRFLKCGAAPSYIKRSGSVFAVRSTSAPIGLMRAADGEESLVEVGAGDTVIMISDGVAPIPDEAAWLIEFLSRPSSLSADAYARELFELAREHSGASDDVTVTVLKIFTRQDEICA